MNHLGLIQGTTEAEAAALSLHCEGLEMPKHLSHRKIACLESGSSPKNKPKNSEQVPF